MKTIVSSTESSLYACCTRSHWPMALARRATSSLRAYWCAWRVTPSERKDEVARLASAIGQCDRVQHAYSDDSVDGTSGFLDLPRSVSIHVNGAGETVTISIGSTFSIPEPYPQAP